MAKMCILEMAGHVTINNNSKESHLYGIELMARQIYGNGLLI